jgi:hypothetical protein
MPVVLQVVELTGKHRGSFLPARSGDYLVWYDVDANEGRGDAGFSPDKDKALRFPDAFKALQVWKMQSTVRPLREDGKPNRPLTAYSIMTEEV